MKTLSFNLPIGLDKFKDSLVIVTDLDTLSQKCEQRIRFLLAEWFLDTTIGLPYFTQFYNASINNKVIIQAINDELRKESDIISINNSDIVYDVETRQSSFTCTIDTIYGSDTITIAGLQYEK